MKKPVTFSFALLMAFGTDSVKKPFAPSTTCPNFSGTVSVKKPLIAPPAVESALAMFEPPIAAPSAPTPAPTAPPMAVPMPGIIEPIAAPSPAPLSAPPPMSRAFFPALSSPRIPLPVPPRAAPTPDATFAPVLSDPVHSCAMPTPFFASAPIAIREPTPAAIGMALVANCPTLDAPLASCVPNFTPCPSAPFCAKDSALCAAEPPLFAAPKIRIPSLIPVTLPTAFTPL